MSNDVKEKPKSFDNTAGDPAATPEIYFDAEMSLPSSRVDDSLDEKRQIDEDDDIRVVNELASMDDDTTLPCFTLRAIVIGSVSGKYKSIHTPYTPPPPSPTTPSPLEWIYAMHNA